MSNTIILQTVCPFCGKTHGVIGNIDMTDYAAPVDGNTSICFKCGGVAIFELHAPGALRRPTAEENRELENDLEVQFALLAWREATK